MQVITADVATGPSRGPDHVSGDNISDDCTHRSPKEGMTDDYISDDYISDDFISDYHMMDSHTVLQPLH